MTVRPVVREHLAALRPEWTARLGDDRVIALDALAAISDTALTRDMAIEIADSGLPNTFVPGRNLVFLTFAGALAYRRGARHLVAVMCETDYSGYPDCREDTIKAMQSALSLGMDRDFTVHTPLMRIDKVGTFALAEQLGGKPLLDLVIDDTHSCYLGDRSRRHDWGYGCANFRRVGCARRASPDSWEDNDARDRQRTAQGDRRHRVPDRLRADHSVGQLADRPCRHHLRAERTVSHSGGAGNRCAIGRADDRHRAGAARSGAAAAGRRLFGRGRGCRHDPFRGGGGLRW